MTRARQPLLPMIVIGLGALGILLGVPAVAPAVGPMPPTDPFELTTLKGDTYKNCRVIKVTPDAITVMHEAGVTRVRFESLSEEWQAKFGYDPAAAAEFVREETARTREEQAARAAASQKRQEGEDEYMATLLASQDWTAAEARATALFGPPLAPAPLPGEVATPGPTPLPRAATPSPPEPTTVFEVSTTTPGGFTYDVYGPGAYPYLYYYYPRAYHPSGYTRPSMVYPHLTHPMVDARDCPIPYVTPPIRRGNFPASRGGSALRRFR